MATQTTVLADTYKDISPSTIWYWNSGLVTTADRLHVRDKYDFDVDAVRESRPYPSDPIASMTSRTRQYRSRSVTGLSRDIRTYSWGAKEIRTELFPLVPNWNHCTGDPDVITPIRLRIKEEAVSLGESLAEYRETAGMFKDFAVGVSRAVRNLRHGRFPRRFKPCDVSAAWLMDRYGVRPLMNDLYDSYQALTSAFGRPIRKTFVLTRREKGTDSYTSGIFTHDISWEVSRRITAYVSYNPNTVTWYDLGNPLEIGWELVPYSFVIDWAVPVGDFLASLDALKDVVDCKHTISTRENAVSVATGSIYNYISIMQNCRASYEGLYRTVGGDIPLPPVPKWDPSRSYYAIINGLALLHQSRACSHKRRRP